MIMTQYSLARTFRQFVTISIMLVCVGIVSCEKKKEKIVDIEAPGVDVEVYREKPAKDR